MKKQPKDLTKLTKSQRFYWKNREKCLKWQKEWREKNEEYNKKRLKKWQIENPEKVNAISRRFRKNNPEKIKDIDKRANEKCRFGRPRIGIFKRDNWICFKCKKKFTEDRLMVHHKDGKGTQLSKKERNNDLNNLITICKSCHSILHRTKVKKL